MEIAGKGRQRPQKGLGTPNPSHPTPLPFQGRPRASHGLLRWLAVAAVSALAVLPLSGCATAEPAAVEDEWGFEERWPWDEGMFAGLGQRPDVVDPEGRRKR